MKIQYFRKKCISCNFCCEELPEFWKLNLNDAKADLLGSIEKNNVFSLSVENIFLPEMENCKMNCPAGAIRIHK